eukprot:PITA_22174
MDVPNAVPVWVRLPHLSLHCWGDESVKAIGNAVSKFIDRFEPKENMHACARICVEVDLGKGLPEAIKIKVDQWTHIQQVDYEKLPFKCKVCHEYGHFVNRCSKSKTNESEGNIEISEGAWEQVKKKKPNPPPGPSSKAPLENPSIPSHLSSSAPPFPSSSNPFESLSAEDPISPPPSPRGNALTISSPLSLPQPSPPPTVDRILTRNKTKENNLTSVPPRKVGRKSNKEIMDENAAKDKASCWDTITTDLQTVQGRNIFLGGDLNLIRNADEKLGGNFYVDPSRDSLETIIQTHNLVDIPPQNGKYTWSNKRIDNSNIKERLDRILVQEGIVASFPIIKSKIIQGSASDHKPVVLILDKGRNLGPLPFKYNKAWDSKEEFQNLIQEQWAKEVIGSPHYIWETKLNSLRSVIKQ